MSSTLFDKTFIGLNWTFLGSIFLASLNFVVLVILSRLLTPNDFGIVSAALLVINLSFILTEFGVGPAIIHQQSENLEQFNSVLIFSLFMGLITNILVFFSSNLISVFFKIPELEIALKLLSFLFVFKSISAITESLLIKRLEFKRITFIKLVSYTIGYTCFSVLLAYLDYSFWSIIIGFSITIILETILFTYFSKIKIRLFFSFKHLRKLLKYGSAFSVNKILANIALQSDNFVIAKTLGTVSLGLYSRAYQIFTLPINIIGQSINKVLFSSFSRIKNDKETISSLYRNMVFALSIFSGPITLFLFFSADDIVEVLLGKQWSMLVPALKALAISFYFRLGYKLADPLINAFGNINLKAFYQLIYASSVLILGYFGSSYGIEGVATGVGISIFIYYLLTTSLILRYLKLSFISFIKLHKISLFFTLINFVVLFFLKFSFNFNSAHFNLLFQILILLSINLITIFLLRKNIANHLSFTLNKFPVILNLMTS